MDDAIPAFIFAGGLTLGLLVLLVLFLIDLWKGE